MYELLSDVHVPNEEPHKLYMHWHTMIFFEGHVMYIDYIATVMCIAHCTCRLHTPAGHRKSHRLSVHTLWHCMNEIFRIHFNMDEKKNDHKESRRIRRNEFPTSISRSREKEKALHILCAFTLGTGMGIQTDECNKHRFCESRAAHMKQVSI